MSLNRDIKQGTIISDINFGGEEGNEYASFILGYKRDYKKKDEQYPGSITIAVKAFRHNAVFLNKYFKKMDTIIVDGQLDKDEDYTNKDGELVTNNYFIRADSFYFDGKKASSDEDEENDAPAATKATSANKSPFGAAKTAAAPAPAKSPFASKLNKIGK